ncbi:MAG: YgcG family protein [Cyclobacteriaceae bacterium]|nr:YgcG family protein [Cyclobacteriaceae bacterium]
MLEKDLELYEDSTTNQIAILIVQSLDGEVLEDYSIKVAEKWKLGSKKNDNGVLLLIAIEDHKMRIEVGEGLEGALTDAHSNRIIRNEMAPEFRRGDYDAGVINAITSIKAAIRGEYAAEDASNDFDNMDPSVKWIVAGVIFLFLGIFAGVGLFSEGAMTWVLYAFLTPFYAVFQGLLFSWWLFGGYLIVYPLLRLWIVKSGKKLLKWESPSGGGSSGSGSSWSSGGSDWSSSSSSSSSSSFSGGGGSFGGGGSSGSW